MDQEQAWRPIGELEAPRLLAALVEPKEPAEREPAEAGAGRPRQMAGNRGRRVAAGAIALAGAGALVLWWIPPHGAPTRASLPGTGTPGSAASARAGDAPGAIQEPDVNKRIAAAVVAGAAMAGSAGAQTAVQWRVEDGGNGHWYQGVRLSIDAIGWGEARTVALGWGGDLAQLETRTELDFVYSAAAKESSLWRWTVGPWLGGYQLPGSPEPGGGWQWIDGHPIDNSFWCAGEPYDYIECGAHENHLHFFCNGGCQTYPVPSPSPTLNDMPEAGFCNCCDNTNLRVWITSAIIEWSADCNNDGIVDFGQIRDGSTADANANGIPDTCECAGADITANGNVDGADLGALLAFWGPAGTVLPEADLNRDGIVDGADLGLLLANWGPCGG